MKAHLATKVRRQGLALLVAGMAVVGLAGCGGDDAPSGADGDASGAATADGGGSEGGGATEVAITDFTFTPEELTVPAGTTVTWTNEDTAPHAIQDDSDLGAEEGPDMAQGDTFQLTYDEPGTYPYLCGVHNYMTGTVTVS